MAGVAVNALEMAVDIFRCVLVPLCNFQKNFVLGFFSLKNEEPELNDGERFISEIIGELDGTYRGA